jgi:hypothetical protein
MLAPSFAAEEGLDGLFGAKFGKVMSASESCMTNNIGELAYDYYPEKTFRRFSSYILFASPVTRKVSQIRAVANVGYSEVDEEVESVIRTLEMKFDKKAIKIDDDTKTIGFKNGDNFDTISVKKDGKKIIIDASSYKLRKLTELEIVIAETLRYAKDKIVLALRPGKIGGSDKIFSLDSVFGIKFGRQYEKPSYEQNNKGSWINNVYLNPAFMDCKLVKVFSTEKTKKVFMIRAIYEGNEYVARRDQIRRVIESETGYKFEEDDDDNDLSMMFGDVLITIEKNAISNLVMVDFVRISLYKQAEKEHEEVQRKAAAADMDAL